MTSSVAARGDTNVSDATERLIMFNDELTLQ